MPTQEEMFDMYGLHPQLPATFDHQATGAFQECQRMFYWHHVLGRVPQDEAFALVWGRVVHKITEMWQTTQNIDDIYKFITANISEVTDDRYGRNANKMLELFVQWTKFNQMNPLEILRTEQPATVFCNEPCIYHPDSPQGCNLMYGGRLDRIARWQQMVGPLDIKTSVMEDTDPVAEFKPSHQMMGYLWLTAHLLNAHPWGIIVERIVCNKSKLHIKRFPVSYSKDLIVEWAINERRMQDEIQQKYAVGSHDPSVWTQNHFRCWKPFACHYRDVCLSPRDSEFRLKILRDNFPERRWDFNNPDAEEVTGGER